MKLKLLAPVRTDFSLVNEQLVCHPKDYAKYWERVRNDVCDSATCETSLQAYLENAARNHWAREPTSVGTLSQSPFYPVPCAFSDKLHEFRFPHAHHNSPYNRYRSLSSNALERSLHALEIVLTSSTDLSMSLGGGHALNVTLDGIIWRVYDHSVSLLEADLSLGHWTKPLSSTEIGPALDQLQQQGIDLGEALARQGIDLLLNPLFDWLRAETRQWADFLEKPPSSESPVNSHETPVLWVTRTLIFEPGDAAHRDEVILHWLKHSDGQDELGDSLSTPHIDVLRSDSQAHLMRWLNYLFREDTYRETEYPPLTRSGPATVSKPFCDAWEAMVYAQFFYAALDNVDNHLTTILARSLSISGNQRIDKLEDLLEQNIRKAHLLLMQFHDSAKYYPRTVKAEMDSILAYWGFDSVLIAPVQSKIKLCQERLSLLHQQEAAKSSVYTDMILLGITIIAIVDIALALVAYGRTMASDADLASYDVARSNFIDRFAALPTDVILIASSLVSLLLIVLYFYYRKQQTV